jgi:murein L,D-transpeptidase YafK
VSSARVFLIRRRGVVAVLALALCSCTAEAESDGKVDLVRVVKSESRLYLLSEEQVVAKFRIALGKSPEGHKQEQGDGKTPEGEYVLDWKNPDSKFYRSIHVSYPNGQDRSAAKKRGVDPGGDIMIHGQKNGLAWLTPLAQNFNWTDGCIAVTDEEMDVIWEAVEVPTPIEILP